MDAQATPTTLDSMPLDWLCINTVRTLAMDAVQQANSGHPGTPMALAPAAYVLWSKFLRHNPGNPQWFNRDRFVLSAGHASMLLYALLHLTGYDLSLDEIRNFRQWGSKTPGHPEHGVTPGVETTTGPLGQGLMNAVGMAMAEAHLAAVYNRPGHELVDHHTFVFCSDGDLMEGASHEAASLAGHLGLGKLIVLYDDNHITIEGSTALAYSDDVAKRFEAYHWHVQTLGEEANNLGALEQGFANAINEGERPSLIIVRSHIAYGAPHAHDTAQAHGAPLGEEEIRATKDFYGWPREAKFLVPEKAAAHMREALAKGEQLESRWQDKLASYRSGYPELASQFAAAIQGTPAAGWDQSIPAFPPDGPMATRVASGKVLNSIADKLPWLIGGSGDLAPSTDSLIKSSGDFEKGSYHNRNIHWGIREHVMCAACSGMALHSGIRPYAATFLIFTDYARPAIRLAAMSGLPLIYVLTHDSIGLGEDGPTHQPVEHLASLRAMPNMCLIRPADANEVAYAWRAAIARLDGPTMLVLTRQALPIFDREKVASAAGVLRGAYVLSKEKGDRPDIILMASGSEVQLVLEAQSKLGQEQVDARVVSMPSFELFRTQPAAYRDEVLPPAVTARLAIEAGVSFGWCEWVNQGEVIGVDRYGASAPYRQSFQHLGLTVEQVVEKAKRVLAA